jgi:acetyltransferase-like isoleucine patch superfamily enzyme
MANDTMKNIKKNFYGIIRFLPSASLDRFRAYFFRIIGVKVGSDVRFSIGSIIDVWQKGVPGSVGDKVYIGPYSLISGGVTIGHNTSINSNVTISASPPNLIDIGNNCLIAQNVVIRSDDHKFDDVNSLIRDQGHIGANIFIGQNCWIGANAVVLKGVNLGAHSVVGAGAIVTKSFPAYSVVVGNPARLIKSRVPL